MMLIPPTSGMSSKHRPSYASFAAYPALQQCLQAYFNIDATNTSSPGTQPNPSSANTTGAATAQVAVHPEPQSPQHIHQLIAEIQQHALTVSRTIHTLTAQHMALIRMLECLATKVAEPPRAQSTQSYRGYSNAQREPLDTLQQVKAPARHVPVNDTTPIPNLQLLPESHMHKTTRPTSELLDVRPQARANSTYSKDEILMAQTPVNTAHSKHDIDTPESPPASSFGSAAPKRESLDVPSDVCSSAITTYSRQSTPRRALPLVPATYKYFGPNPELLDIRPTIRTSAAHHNSSINRRHSTNDPNTSRRRSTADCDTSTRSSTLGRSSSCIQGPRQRLKTGFGMGGEPMKRLDTLMDVGTKRRNVLG